MDFKIKKIDIFLYSLCIFSVMSGCKKFVQVGPPPTKIEGATVYSDNTSAAAAITSLYDIMMTNAGFSSGNKSISFLGGMAADELKNYYSTYLPFNQFYLNALTSSSNGSSNNYFWQELYNEIYISNAVLEGVRNSKTLTDSIRTQIIGEAEFIRAFLHFYAVNLYGDVPLVTSTNYLVNNSLHRTPSVEVYRQIVADLKDAQLKLSNHFVDYQGMETSERIRPNKFAATALLARVYLYQQKWDSAEVAATAVINSPIYSLDALTDVFLANSNEAIWQLQPVFPGNNTFDAQLFVLTSKPGNARKPVAMSSYLLGAFEATDQRLANWVGSFTDPSSGNTYYYPFKYKVYLTDQPVTEYLMVLRLAEQYLIRAEAEAHLGEGDVVNDLNTIRSRAGLPDYSGPTDQTSLLKAIYHERQVELFTEWGHRWFDLKRTGNINSVMGDPGGVCTAKGGTWRPEWALLPLPLSELQVNHNLTQNSNY